MGKLPKATTWTSCKDVNLTTYSRIRSRQKWLRVISKSRGAV
jgi:hypothetical protein